MKKRENIFTACARAVECRRPARRRSITKLMRTPPGGAVGCVRRMAPGGSGMIEGRTPRAPAESVFGTAFGAPGSGPNVRRT